MTDITGQNIPVHDHGFVRVIDTMGDDAAIVQAARVSYGDGTKGVSSDQGLLNYLMKHRHTSPFEMCEIKTHLKMPIFVARQWIRHRTANVNEISGRYSVLANEFYMPDTWYSQSADNKQGSGEAMGGQENVKNSYLSCMETAFGWYDLAVSSAGDPQNNMAREQARFVLPLSTYTEMYWKIDLHNLFHFIKLRSHPHAQAEIRAYADALATLVMQWCPMAYAAWVEYQRDAVTLSKSQIETLKAAVKYLELLQPAYASGDDLDSMATYLRSKAPGLPRRDRKELEELFA
jgi:thymidylate synthase (FAD)